MDRPNQGNRSSSVTLWCGRGGVKPDLTATHEVQCLLIRFGEQAPT